MKKFSITKRQQKAFDRIEKAFKAAQKTGLVFYAKSDSIVAYTKKADEYNNQVDFGRTLATGFDQIENDSRTGMIIDSGADDYPCYRSEEDEKKYS